MEEKDNYKNRVTYVEGVISRAALTGKPRPTTKVCSHVVLPLGFIQPDFDEGVASNIVERIVPQRLKIRLIVNCTD